MAAVEIRRPVNAVTQNIRDFTSSGNYYCTDEMARELAAINSGLEHMKLDADVTSSSKEWQKKHNPNQSYQGAPSVLMNVGSVLNDVKHQMRVPNVSNQQENDIREMHHWGMSNLKNIQREAVNPYATAAHERLQQFSDHIGVTDRYLGYRNNLTRSRIPTVGRPAWKDKPFEKPTLLVSSYKGVPLHKSVDAEPLYPPPGELYGMTDPIYLTGSLNRSRLGKTLPPKLEYRGYQTIDSLYPQSSTMYIDRPATCSHTLEQTALLNKMNAVEAAKAKEALATCQPSLRRPHTTMSIQERCGINTTFPGKTEYMKRYGRPPTDLPTSDFTINPAPNFAIHGRPLARSVYEVGFTEYQTRFEWPDGRKLIKLPWRRS